MQRWNVEGWFWGHLSLARKRSKETNCTRTILRITLLFRFMYYTFSRALILLTYEACVRHDRDSFYMAGNPWLNVDGNLTRVLKLHYKLFQNLIWFTMKVAMFGYYFFLMSTFFVHVCLWCGYWLVRTYIWWWFFH